MHAVAVAETRARRAGPRPRRAASAPEQRHPGVYDVLTLQRLAGNRAVAGLVAGRSQRARFADSTGATSGPVSVQRAAEIDRQQDLQSTKYRGSTRLQGAFDNAPPMGIGETGEAVRLVQEGLVADGFAMPISTKPEGTLDGIFGQETDGVVRRFQLKHGLTDANGFADGRVGRRTMGKLDELATSGPPDDLPPCPILGDEETVAFAGAPGVIGAPMIPGVTCALPVPPPRPEDLCEDKPCGGQWIQVKPRLFASVCNDTVRTGPPLVRTVGCTPGRPGRVGFFTGAPAWQLNGSYLICGKDDKTIQVGFIQTVQMAMNGSLYRDPATGVDKLGHRECVTGARDCTGTPSPPWYDAPGSLAGPHPFGGPAPVLSDTPNLSRSTHDGSGRLQTMVFQGAFNVWLIAQLPNGTIVFIHHWRIALGAIAQLGANADPCNISQWTTAGRAAAVSKGPGQGTATPVLTGACAAALAKPC